MFFCPFAYLHLFRVDKLKLHQRLHTGEADKEVSSFFFFICCDDAMGSIDLIIGNSMKRDRLTALFQQNPF